MLTLRLLLKIRFALKINTNEMITTLNNDERDIISISNIYICSYCLNVHFSTTYEIDLISYIFSIREMILERT